MWRDQESYTQYLEKEVAALKEQVASLGECCCRRGARMQTLKDALDAVTRNESVPMDRWLDINSWFGEDNVPKGFDEMVRVSGVPYKVPRSSLP